MSLVTRTCQKCGKQFKATMPTGMDEIDRGFWEVENTTCEKCSGPDIDQVNSRRNEQWDRNGWSPDKHDGKGVHTMEVGKTRGIRVVDLGDDC